jgi:hypothetical protein
MRAENLKKEYMSRQFCRPCRLVSTTGAVRPDVAPTTVTMLQQGQDSHTEAVNQSLAGQAHWTTSMAY